jgi:hypothetical protein
MAWCLKYYECSGCGTKWTDEWSCACNDRCPNCDTETEPYDDKDLTYVVEPSPAGTFAVMFSPDGAEDSPDYEPIGVFSTRERALAFLTLRLADWGALG